jgi:hypothetical protein
MLEELKNFHASLQAAHEDDSGLDDEETGDVAEEKMAGVPLEKIMTGERYRKLRQVAIDQNEERLRLLEHEAGKMFVFWQRPAGIWIATRQHAEENKLTGWKPGLPIRHIVASLEE